MKIFSERYHFKIQLTSVGCCYLSQDTGACPGNLDECIHNKKSEICQDGRGTTVKVQFYPAYRIAGKEELEIA